MKLRVERKRAYMRLACLVLLATAAGVAVYFQRDVVDPLADLRVDSNRDGRIDEADEGVMRSAIILVNCDDDDGDRMPDNWPGSASGWGQVPEKLKEPDAKVNGTADLEDVGRIELWKLGDAGDFRVVLRLERPPAGENVYFSEIGAHRRIRVLLPGPAGREILGPHAGPSAELPKELLNGRGWLELGVEGIEFGAAVGLRLEIWRNGRKLSEDTVEIRCAPFMALSNTDPVEATLLAIEDRGDGHNNYDFIEAFDCADGVRTRMLDVLFPEERAYDDPWPQDQWEIGWQSAPGPGAVPRGMRVFLELPRHGELRRASRRELIGPGTGLYEKFLYTLSRQAAASESLNFGGNLECTGPLPGYPFGRILAGNNLGSGPQKPIHRSLLEFFRAQGLQEPSVVDTGWSTVGHIDQLLGVLPSGNDPRVFRIVIASPRKAIEMLESLRHERPSSKIMEGKNGWEMTVARFFENDGGLKKLNKSLQPRIAAVAAQIERELGVRPIEVPALFRPAKKGGVAPWFPPLQNAQVVNGLILTPDPLGPRGKSGDVFKTAYEQALPGVRIVYVDGCFVLHRKKGAVHCASNRLAVPRPETQAWWLLSGN